MTKLMTNALLMKIPRPPNTPHERSLRPHLSSVLSNLSTHHMKNQYRHQSICSTEGLLRVKFTRNAYKMVVMFPK